MSWEMLDFRIPKTKKRKKIENRKKRGKLVGLNAGPTAGRMLWPGMARTPPLTIHRSYLFLVISKSIPKISPRKILVGCGW